MEINRINTVQCLVSATVIRGREKCDYIKRGFILEGWKYYTIVIGMSRHIPYYPPKKLTNKNSELRHQSNSAKDQVQDVQSSVPSSVKELVGSDSGYDDSGSVTKVN